MANENSNPQIQTIPLAKIHDLPGVFISKQPDKIYGGLVTSIQANGVKEPVILRLRGDGEYQLVTGYRRRRASELAKKQDIPALVYEMSAQEAIDYHKRVQNQPDLPIPGKLVELPTQGGKTQKPDVKELGKPTAGDKPAPTAEAKPKDAATTKGDKEQTTASKALDPKTADKPATSTDEAKPKENTTTKDGKEQATAPKAPDLKTADKPATPTDEAKPKENTTAKDGKEQATAPKAPDPKTADKPATPTDEIKPKENIIAKDGKEQATVPKAPDPKTADKPATPTDEVKPKEAPAVKPAVTGPAAKGPAGTAISQVLNERLTPPDDKMKQDIPKPGENESFFILLHPAYLEKSKYNTVSVDQKSEDYKELKKSIELNGVKDPVLARFGDEGTLEILSGQRRHIIATELNYPVPTIIQKISDADAKILVADGNLHRPHISMYDLSRSLRMKMEGMKQKAGRRKKGTFKAEELDSDEKLAQEMGMSVSKLNRLIRLSEATKDVCARVDNGSAFVHCVSNLFSETGEPG